MINQTYKKEISRARAEAAKLRLNFNRAYNLFIACYTPSSVTKADIYSYASGSGAYLKIDTKLGNTVNIQLDPI